MFRATDNVKEAAWQGRQPQLGGGEQHPGDWQAVARPALPGIELLPRQAEKGG